MKQTTEQIATGIMNFLRDPNAKEYQYITDGNNCSNLLVKSEFDEDADFLYTLWSYRGKPQRIGHNLEYSGIYVRDQDKVIDVHHGLSSYLGYGDSIESITRDFTEAMTRRIIEIVGGNRIYDTALAEKYDGRRENYEKYQADEDALRHFFDGKKSVSYEPYVRLDDVPAWDVIGMVVSPVQTCNRYAVAFIAKNANLINERLWEIEVLNKRLADLWATPGDHQYRRKIALCLSDKSIKTVSLDVLTKGKSITVKIEADALRRMNGSKDYSTYHLDAPSRRLWEKTFGRYGTDLYASDIQAITYGKKTLYTKEG